MQRLVGKVSSTCMPKTIKVCVEKKIPVCKSGKTMNYRKKYLVHDPWERCVVGDTVAIQSCRPITDRKTFTLVQIVKEARMYTDLQTGATFTCE